MLAVLMCVAISVDFSAVAVSFLEAVENQHTVGNKLLCVRESD